MLVLCLQLLSKQLGYHRPQPSAPPAQQWQQQNGSQLQPATQHVGWGGQPASQYHQQQQQPPQQVQHCLPSALFSRAVLNAKGAQVALVYCLPVDIGSIPECA